MNAVEDPVRVTLTPTHVEKRRKADRRPEGEPGAKAASPPAMPRLRRETKRRGDA